MGLNLQGQEERRRSRHSSVAWGRRSPGFLGPRRAATTRQRKARSQLPGNVESPPQDDASPKVPGDDLPGGLPSRQQFPSDWTGACSPRLELLSAFGGQRASFGQLVCGPWCVENCLGTGAVQQWPVDCLRSLPFRGSGFRNLSPTLLHEREIHTFQELSLGLWGPKCMVITWYGRVSGPPGGCVLVLRAGFGRSVPRFLEGESPLDDGVLLVRWPLVPSMRPGRVSKSPDNAVDWSPS